MDIVKLNLDKYKGVVIFIVLCVWVMTIGKADTFEAHARGSLVVNRGPCLIYKQPNLGAATDRITNLNFDVELDVCVRLIGSLSYTYEASDTGYVYGLHQGSAWQSHIAIQARDENNHQAWVKRANDKNWSQWAANWWEPVITVAGN